MLRRSLSRTLAACALLCSGAASAEPPKRPSQDPAQVLFDTGVADMEAGKLEKACPAIEASHRMAPMPGTLFTLAECEAKRGRLATATRYYAEYLAQYRTFSPKKKLEQKDRAKISEAQLKKLDLLVPRLTLKLEGHTQTDVLVKRDNEVVAELSLGTAVAVDPGEHVVTTRVPGGPEIEHRVTLAAGETKTLQLTVRSTPLPPAASATGSASASSPKVAPPPDVRPFVIGSWSAGAVGVVGIAIGIVTGILTIEQHNLANRLCKPADSSGTVYCKAEGYAASTRADTFGAVSTAGFALGGLSLGIGIILFAAKPTAPTPSSNVGHGPSTGYSYYSGSSEYSGSTYFQGYSQRSGPPLQSLSLTLRGTF